MQNIVYNCDCLDYMKTLPDKAFELAIVDPPYGDAIENESNDLRFHAGQRYDRYKDIYDNNDPKLVTRTGGTWAAKYGKKIAAWDVAPPQEYFDQLFRVSKNQIIWGGNYFDLPPTRCFLIWRKLTISEDFTMAMCEYAWTSFNGNAKVFEYAPQGSKDDPRFHPTQKPIALYQWTLNKYAKPGDRILDTHVGSGSSRIACWELGFDFVGCEIDPVYWKLQEKRFKEYQTQPKLF